MSIQLIALIISLVANVAFLFLVVWLFDKLEKEEEEEMKGIKVKTDADGYFMDLSSLLVAVGKHLEVLNEIELNGVQKFALAGFNLALAKQMITINKSLIKWGFIEEEIK